MACDTHPAPHLAPRPAPCRAAAVALAAMLAWPLGLSGCASSPDGKRPGASTKAPAAVRPATVPSTPARPLIAMRCGSLPIAVRHISDELELTVGARTYMLQPQRSASGARYASPSYPGVGFWSKGERGSLMLDGRAYPECVRSE